MASATEDYVRNLMRPALRRQLQPIALGVIAKGGGSADMALIRQAIEARHPGMKWIAATCSYGFIARMNMNSGSANHRSYRPDESTGFGSRIASIRRPASSMARL